MWLSTQSSSTKTHSGGQSPNSNHNPDAKSVLNRVRELIFEKDYAAARQLAIPAWMSQGSHGAQYQAAGFLHLLPALPAKWDEGNVNGLRARGGFVIRDGKKYVQK